MTVIANEYSKLYDRTLKQYNSTKNEKKIVIPLSMSLHSLGEYVFGIV